LLGDESNVRPGGFDVTTDKSYYRHSQPNRDQERREKRRRRRKKKEKEEKNREQAIHPPSKFENILILL